MRENSQASKVARVMSRLLTQMVDLLRKRSLVDKVFVSPIRNANEQMAKRDITKHPIIQGVKDVDGDTQGKINVITKNEAHNNDSFMIDLLEYIRNGTKICLVAIDYAGLSTNIANLNNFIRVNSSSKKIIIDQYCQLGRFYVLEREQF